MGKKLDLTGQKFGRLVAIRSAKREGCVKTYWECNCDCGNTKVIMTSSLVAGLSNSCGCLFNELIRNNYLATKGKKDRLENEEGLVGTMHTTKKGSTYKVIAYDNANDILIKFQDAVGYETRIIRNQIKTGNIWNPYLPIICGVGYLGAGTHQAHVLSTTTKVGNVWCNMLKRCYDTTNKNYPSYGGRGVSVVDSWKCFQNFADWYVKQTGYGYGDWQLDKDILVEDNLTYGPETCALVPKELNGFFKRKWESHSTDLEGVHLHNLTGKFFCNLKNKSGKLRVTKEEAQLDYLEMLNQHLIRLSEKYELLVDDCVIQAIERKRSVVDERLFNLRQGSTLGGFG